MQNQHSPLKANTKRVWKNWLFAKAVAISGWLVLLTLALLIWHLVKQVSPMMGSVELSLVERFSLPEDHQVIQIQDINQGRYVVTKDSHCSLNFMVLDPGTTKLKIEKSLPGLCSDKVKVIATSDQSYLVRLSDSGIVRVEQLLPSQQDIEHPLLLSVAMSQSQQMHSMRSWDVAIADQSIMFSIQIDNIWKVFWVDRANPAKIEQEQINQAENLLLLPQLNQFVYTHKQYLFNRDMARSKTNFEPLSKAPDSLFAFENQRSLMLSYEDGSAQKWSLLNRQGKLVYAPIYSVELGAKLNHLQTHRDENAALLVTQDNVMRLFNHVTGQQIQVYDADPAFQQFHLINNNLYGFDNGLISFWKMKNLAAVNTFAALWEGIQYQGYQHKEFLWQTTYAKDYQEPKYSVVPLVVGSLKASFLALILAVPLALVAATYTAYFAPKRLRNWIKPSIEMLESIPSVVLGFIAAIWLAPLAEQFLLSFIVFILLIPVTLFLFSLVYPSIIRRSPWHIDDGWELLIVAILLITVGYLVSLFTPFGDMGVWFSNEILNDVNKSTLVVALAMGLAITPSIYSLAEDAIFEVPTSYKQASFALGASRLQTLRKVVLTLAYPGILSAVALGLGRAFGETMIVLMVTGNTPIADWDLLSGIRALTANLAIELPEADQGSSHYQILFLTALLLFSFTFVINTLAEFLRQWLRRNYQHG